MNDNKDTTKADHQNDLKYLCDLYDQSYGLANLPAELTFRLAHMALLGGDQENAIKIISNKINSNLDDQIFQCLMNFLQLNAPTLTSDGLMAIGKLFLSFRTNESVRKFWNVFFDLLLEKTSPQDVVQYYSDAMRENSNVPYLHLFEVSDCPSSQ